MKRYVKSEDELKPTYSVLVYRCRDDDITVFDNRDDAERFADSVSEEIGVAVVRVCKGDDYGNPIYEILDRDNDQ